MRILILGGTKFIGPHLIDAATRRGHEITLFNRGETNPDEFDEYEQLRGDRDEGDYGALTDGEWDAVIDTSAYWPRAVREALDVLQGSVEHYVFVSTISVYDEYDPDGYDEDAPLATVDDPETEEVDKDTYGGLKVLCEKELDAFEGTVTIVRPGLVAGPRDTTDRFTYWPVKFCRGGDILVPGRPTHPIQYIDVRDLAEFALRVIDDRTAGTFNVVTPRGEHTMGDLVKACRLESMDPGTAYWVAGDFLRDRGVQAWNGLPLWVPPESSLAGIPHCISERAVQAGLEFTPLRQTVGDTLGWFLAARHDELKVGLSDDRESELLTEYANARV